MKFFSKKPKTNSTSITIHAPSTEELKRLANATSESNSPMQKKNKKPSKLENDIKFQQLSQKVQEHLQNGEIGFYRNDLFAIAEILKHENRLNAALESYMYVFYLDTTGISSLSGLRKGQKARPSVAPGVVNRIDTIRKKLSLSDEELKNRYFSCPLDSIFPNALFSYEESYEMLVMCMAKDYESVDALIKTKT